MEGQPYATVPTSRLPETTRRQTECPQTRLRASTFAVERLALAQNRNRYHAQAERHYRRAVEEFERLKALQQEIPNKPISDPQPEPNETT